MNLRFIEAFVWVARLRSFTAAAEKLYTTQAAISARIATLEDDFGVKLFERDKRTVALTHSGKSFWNTQNSCSASQRECWRRSPIERLMKDSFRLE